jgi:hypothetical protein
MPFKTNRTARAAGMIPSTRGRDRERIDNHGERHERLKRKLPQAFIHV